MYGLAILTALLVYFVCWFGIAYFVFKLGHRKNWRLTWFWVLFALIFYHAPVAALVVPTRLAMHNYCNSAGFWLYKTPRQWSQENPGIAQPLTTEEKEKSLRSVKTDSGIRIYHLNKHFDERKVEKETESKNIRQLTQTLVDRRSKEVVAKWIDYRINKTSWAYFLYGRESCSNIIDSSRWRIDGKQFSHYSLMFKNIGEDPHGEK